jgi:hypothetical protein
MKPFAVKTARPAANLSFPDMDKKSAAKIVKCYRLLETAADASAPAPPNQEIAFACGFKSPGHAAHIVSVLEKRGLITVRRLPAARVVKITATGRVTKIPIFRGTEPAAQQRARRAWTPAAIRTIEENAATRPIEWIASAVGHSVAATRTKLNDLRIRRRALGLADLLPPPTEAPPPPKIIRLGPVTRARPVNGGFQFKTCQFPRGDGRPDWNFCGAPAMPGRPYCDHHSAICYVPNKKPSDKTESDQ